MEFLSASQVQKYEDIIDHIKTEFEKHEQLQKELEKENDNITISRLSNSKLTQKISHVNVKVFSDVRELFNLYQEELQSDFSELTKSTRCKYYLIEVYISKTLMQKIRDLKWLLHISVKSEHVCVSKTLILTRRIPVLEIIPINESVINCVVEATLVLPSRDKWMSIKLDTIQVDISYHFQTDKEKQKTESKTKNILQITKCYNQELDIEQLRKLIILEYKLICDVEKTHFLQSFLRNSYHRLNIELFSQLESDSNFTLKFLSGLEKHMLVYNQKEKLLIIKANVYDLCLLKKYFCKEFHCQGSVNGASVLNIKPKENIPEDPHEICVFYGELRKSWSELPI